MTVQELINQLAPADRNSEVFISTDTTSVVPQVVHIQSRYGKTRVLLTTNDVFRKLDSE